MLVVKSFGAQKIYCIKQEPTVSNDDESAALKVKLDGLRYQVSVLRSTNDDLLRGLSTIRSFTQAQKSKQDMVQLIDDLKNQISTLKAARSAHPGDKIVDPGLSGDALETEQRLVDSELEKRRRITMRMIGEICEQMNLSKSDLVGDLGLDMCESTFVVRGS
jgi:hypothetical protein